MTSAGELRVAVLGCGSIGRRHLGNLRTLGLTDLIACDPSPEVCRALREELHVPCVTSWEEVRRAEPEVVLVASPTALHQEQAQAAAQAGCHLFIEKPLAASREGLDALLLEADRRRLVTMVACNMRFHPGPMAVKRLLDGDAIGQPLSARIQTGSYLPRWRPAHDYRQSYSASPEQGGAILDCIHEIDLALWFFGPARLARRRPPARRHAGPGNRWPGGTAAAPRVGRPGQRPPELRAARLSALLPDHRQ